MCCVLGTMVIQMKNQTVDIKLLIYQNTQRINILAQAPEYRHVYVRLYDNVQIKIYIQFILAQC